MDQLTSNDIHFLVALLASEESAVHELETEFAARGVEQENVQSILRGLIVDGTIGVTKLQGESFHDYKKDECLELIEDWNSFVQTKLQIFLTDEGYHRWDVDDWGITTERARYLIFSNQGQVLRV